MKKKDIKPLKKSASKTLSKKNDSKTLKPVMKLKKEYIQVSKASDGTTITRYPKNVSGGLSSQLTKIEKIERKKIKG